MRTVDRARLQALIERERESFVERHPVSRRLFDEAARHLLGGVPMSWMRMWVGGFPVYFDEANGALIRDVDGHTYTDFCLGDTGAMAGHSPDATVRAILQRVQASGGVTTMLPTADAAWVGAELARRFGLPYWQFTLTATDANRFALRLCRNITGRPKVLVFAWCYHGTVDETFVVIEDGKPRSRPGNVGPAIDPTETTVVCEFNDLAAVEAALAQGDIACVLMEPALTNIGIVLPEPGFIEGVREATRRAGSYLIIDETHTFSAGPGGCTEAWHLEPDLVTIGKSLAGGIPFGAYGVSAEIAAAIAADQMGDYVDTGGIGGTLAGNALSLAAAKATLAGVLTPENFARMKTMCDRFVAGSQDVIERYGAPFCLVQLGARCEYRFTPIPPRSGGESAAAHDAALDEFLHLWMLNRGVLITPFHNMALMCPATTEADVDRHNTLFAAACEALFG